MAPALYRVATLPSSLRTFRLYRHVRLLAHEQGSEFPVPTDVPDFREYPMNAITFPRHFSVRKANAVHDVGDSIKSWGKRGMVSGGLFGFTLAAVLVAIPLTTDVLTFGTIGTLIVGAVECAVIAGGFAAMAAALYSQGVLRSGSAGFERTIAADAVWPQTAMPLSDWPARWAFPGRSLTTPIQPATVPFQDAAEPSLEETLPPSGALAL